MPGLPIWRLADPLLVLLVVLFIGLFVVTRRRKLLSDKRTRWPALAAWGAWLLIWLLSSAGFASLVFYAAEGRPVNLDQALQGTNPEKRILVVLSGGSLRPPEDDMAPSELIGGSAFPRALGAARIYRRYGFERVIVSGSAPPSLSGSWGYYSVMGMAEVAERYGVPRDRLVLETMSTNTRENAAYCALLTRAYGAETVVVVTSAIHMPRALGELRAVGIDAIPAPVEVGGLPGSLLSLWLPSVYGLEAVHLAVHETLGRLKP